MQNIKYVVRDLNGNSVLPNQYSTPNNAQKAAKQNNLQPGTYKFEAIPMMSFESADGRNTSRGKQFLGRKQKNHSTRRNFR